MTNDKILKKARKLGANAYMKGHPRQATDAKNIWKLIHSETHAPQDVFDAWESGYDTQRELEDGAL